MRLPEFSLQRVRHYCTRLSADMFLYENERHDFKANFTTDQDHIVMHYPELARRVFSG